MKIYTMDLCYRGCIVTVASSREAAREQMRGEPNYDETAEIEEHEIKEGFVFMNMGDM